MKHTAKVRFVSMEPLMGSAPEFDPTPDWIICGRLTGHGRKNDPTKGQLITITRQCVYGHIPLFMKSNLQEIWGGKLIQEWPK
jgi:protein gp37